MIIAGIITDFIGTIIVGALVGLAARAVMPGKDDMSMPMTIVLGIAGGFIGGIVASGAGVIFGFIVSVICAAALLFGYNKFIRGKAAA